MRDFSNCPANVASKADYPLGFLDNPTALCGIPRPEQILLSLSACCDGPVDIFNGCFQYCETSLDMMAFTNCVRLNVDIDPHFIGTCNKAAAKQSAEHGVHANLAESNDWLLYLWKGLQRVSGSGHNGL